MIFTALHEGFLLKSRLGFSPHCALPSQFLYPDLDLIAPGLYKNEKQVFGAIFNCHSGFVYSRCRDGLLCGYANGVGIFVSFEMGGAAGALPIELEPRISEYLSLMMRLIFAFGLAFELPVVLLLLARAGR